MGMHGPVLILKGKEFVECYHGCDCSCHKHGGMHIVACCSVCLKCKQRIAMRSFETHCRDCHDEPGEQKKD